MAPPNENERRQALTQPGATAALLQEFERLAAEFFLFDPQMITVEEELRRFERLKTLNDILFPGGELKLSPTAAEVN